MRLAQYLRLIAHTRPAPTAALTSASLANTRRLIARMDEEALSARRFGTAHIERMEDAR